MVSDHSFHYVLELRFYNEPNMDVKTKKRICRDIFGSSLLVQFGVKLCEDSNNCMTRLLGLNRGFYASRVINVNPTFSSEPPVREHVFVCFARRNWVKSEFYISEEYNLNTTSEAPEDYIPGRFIFFKLTRSIYLFGLSEIPAKTFSNPDYGIENLYAKRREKHAIGKLRGVDR